MWFVENSSFFAEQHQNLDRINAELVEIERQKALEKKQVAKEKQKIRKRKKLAAKKQQQKTTNPNPLRRTKARFYTRSVLRTAYVFARKFLPTTCWIYQQALPSSSPQLADKR